MSRASQRVSYTLFAAFAVLTFSVAAISQDSASYRTLEAPSSGLPMIPLDRTGSPIHPSGRSEANRAGLDRVLQPSLISFTAYKSWKFINGKDPEGRLREAIVEHGVPHAKAAPLASTATRAAKSEIGRAAHIFVIGGAVTDLLDVAGLVSAAWTFAKNQISDDSCPESADAVKELLGVTSVTKCSRGAARQEYGGFARIAVAGAGGLVCVGLYLVARRRKFLK